MRETTTFAGAADLQRTANGLFAFLRLDKDDARVSAELARGKALDLESEVPNLYISLRGG